MTEPAASIFSSDPAIAKRQMLAIVFLLTAFGHTDGKFDLAEKRFVQEKIAELVLGRMLQAVADPLARHVATERATTPRDTSEGIVTSTNDVRGSRYSAY